jgi:hypothetical protein
VRRQRLEGLPHDMRQSGTSPARLPPGVLPAAAPPSRFRQGERELRRSARHASLLIQRPFTGCDEPSQAREGSTAR